MTEPDAFSRTATALSGTLRAHPALLANAPAQFRNYLLDACGSDHRPLVELLLSVAGELRPRLETADAVTRPWESRRAPLVHQLVATRYLQPDVARWLVDSWGAALGLAPTSVAHPTLVFAGTGRGDAADDTRGEGTTGGFTRATGMAPAAAPPRGGASAPAPLRPPLWSGGATSGRGVAKTASAIAARPVSRGSSTVVAPGMARAITARSRTLAPAMNAARLVQMQRVERISFALIIGAMIVAFIAAAIAISGRRDENVLAAAVLPVVTAGTPADSVRAAATGPMRPLPATNTGDSASGAADDPGANAAIVHADGIGGNSGETTAASSSATRPSVPMDGAHAIALGLGGRYRVAQRVLAVSGSPTCSKVADALARGRTSIEVITHIPGTFSFTLASRDVIGTLDGSAYFEAGPMNGTTDGVKWNFRMRGRFTDHGFTADTQTATEAILRWGRTQSCMTVAELVAERIPE